MRDMNRREFLKNAAMAALAAGAAEDRLFAGEKSCAYAMEPLESRHKRKGNRKHA